MAEEAERVFALAALLWLAGLRLWLEIGAHALGTDYAVPGAILMRYEKTLSCYSDPSRDQNGHSNISTLSCERNGLQHGCKISREEY